MKIAFLADPLDTQYAGIHVFCKELLHALDKLNLSHQIDIFRAVDKKEFKNLNEVVFPIKKQLMLHQRARLFTRFPRYIKKHGYDIVVELAHFGPFGLPETIKQVTFIHDLTPLTHKKFHGVLSQKLHRLLMPKVFKKAHRILCNSSQTQKDIIDFSAHTESKIEVVPLGISEIYTPKFNAKIIKDLKISKPFLLHVGTLEPRKNIPFLIKAFDKIREENQKSEFQLVLVGKLGWDYEELLASIEKSKYKSDIILTDYISQDKLPILYSHAECLVMPSHYEGFGLPVLEAMACGCPCLLSGEGALREIAEEAAIYFDIKDLQSLVTNLQPLLTNQEHILQWKEKALAQAQKYTWQNTAQAIITSLEKLAISS